MALPIISSLIKVVGVVAGLGGEDKHNKKIASSALVTAAGLGAFMLQAENLVEAVVAGIVAFTAAITALQAVIQELKAKKITNIVKSVTGE